MSANEQNPLQATLAELTRQHTAIVKRQLELEQQLQAAQTKLAGLGFMQLGKKVQLHAEIESLNGKLTTNRQLQENLTGRIAAARAQLEAALADVAPAEDPVPTLEVVLPEEEAPAEVPVPVLDAPPIAEDEPADAPAPVLDAPPIAEDEPADTPAPVLPVIPAAPKKSRAIAPRRPIPRAPRPVLDDMLPLEQQVAQLLSHLEDYYPERQLFSAEVLTADARAALLSLAQRSGLSVMDFLTAHGWQAVTSAEGRALRLGRYTTPGCEPAVIQPRLQSVLARLEKHYPDKTITRSIQHDHKSLAQDVSALSVWLGYPSAAAMLTAYGFRYDVPASGRPATDVDGVIAALKAAYASQPKPRTIAQIAADHPEYAAALKTLQNQAPRRFGMSLRQYFVQQGLM